MSLENYFIPEESGQPSYNKLVVHTFRAILQEYLDGAKSGAECRAAIETIIGGSLTADDITDITNILAYIDAGADIEDKTRRMDRLYRVLILSESVVPWYNTRATLKDRLNLT